LSYSIGFCQFYINITCSCLNGFVISQWIFIQLTYRLNTYTQSHGSRRQTHGCTYVNFKIYFTWEISEYCNTIYLGKRLACFICSSQKLNIEIGRHYGIDKKDRLCLYCFINEDNFIIQDNYHVFFNCPRYDDIRRNYLFNCYTGPTEVIYFYYYFYYHYHWWTASIKPRLLFSHSDLVSWGLPFLQFFYNIMSSDYENTIRNTALFINKLLKIVNNT